MTRNETLQIRIDSKMKEQLDELFDAIGLDTQAAIKLFLKQSLLAGGIPFKLRKAPPNTVGIQQKKTNNRVEENPNVDYNSLDTILIDDLYD